MSEGLIQDCTRIRHLPVPAETAWAWLTQVQNVFTMNVFHSAAQAEEALTRRGLRVEVTHRFGLVTQPRVARITRCEPFHLAWSEVREDGPDFFPHGQNLELIPQDDGTCVLHNHLRGQINLPGARWWFVPAYRQLVPFILDAETRLVERAVRGAR